METNLKLGDVRITVPWLTLAADLDLGAETWSTPAAGWSRSKCGSVLVTANRAGDLVAFDGTSLTELWRRRLGAVITASPTTADINHDGESEVIIGTENGMLHVLRLSDGTAVWCSCCGSAIRASAAVADVDHDGQLEVLVGGYGTWMFCLEGETGRRKWRRYLPKHEFYGGTKRGVVSSPLIADVDADGELEVLTGIRSRRIYCLAGKSGRLKWFREMRYDPDSSPSFAVVDGMPTVIIGGGEHTGGSGDNALIGLRGSDGAELWRAGVHGGIDSSPIIGDFNGDGRLEVVATSLADASCYSVDASTGRRLWAYRFGPTYNCIHDENNICRPTGGIYFTEHAVCRSYTTPLVADLDADGRLEIVVGSNNGTLAVLDASTGSPRYVESTGGLVRGSPILADLGDEGRMSLVVPSGNCLLVYRTRAVGNNWPMFKGQPDHLGWLSPDRLVHNGLVVSDFPRPRFVLLRLLWHWFIVDAVCFVRFHLKRRFGNRSSVSHYYY